MRARGTTRWAPRLGRIRVDRLENGRPGARGVDDGPRPDLQIRAGQEVAGTQRPVQRRRLHADTPGLDPGDRRRPGTLGKRGPDDREGQAGVVLHAVVIEQSAPQAATPQGGGDRDGLIDRQAPVPPAIVAGAEDVVERQARVVERLAQERDAADREQLRLERDEVRGVAQQPAPFGERLADESDLELLQVAQPAVDEA
jgi:hypothetical protein